MKRLGVLSAAALVCTIGANAHAQPNYPALLPSSQGCVTCHVSAGGGGPRNAFGQAFPGAGRMWTQELCEADSDGDGASNGVELGDPDCDGMDATFVSAPGDMASVPPAMATCGDGAIEGDEACDGAELGGQTCGDVGNFDGGTLACASDCTFDTSACEAPAGAMCGNDIIEGNEACDGAELAGQTCSDVGDFDGGTLACASDCTIDTSGCTKDETPDETPDPEPEPEEGGGCSQVGAPTSGPFGLLALLGLLGFRRRKRD